MRPQGNSTDTEDKAQLMSEKVVADGNADIPVEYVSRALMSQLARLMSVDAGGVDVRYGPVLVLGTESLFAVGLRVFLGR